MNIDAELAFEGGEGKRKEKKKLARKKRWEKWLWICTTNGRKLPDDFSEIAGG